MSEKDKIVLSANNLSVLFKTTLGDVCAVNNISFDLKKGEKLAVVGESGSGKSQSFLAMLGLLSKNGKATGEVLFKDENLLKLKQNELDKFRGSDICMIFQDPMTSLNPSLTILTQLNEVLIKHKKLTKKQATSKSLEMLKKVGIPEPEKRLKSYPHELSGGMRQRIMIAISLICDPQIIIADEPTTALDVTIQAQILNLFDELQQELNTSLILITHDLGVVAGICESMLVIYAGKIVEKGKVIDLFENPKHPYTLGLLQSTPNIANSNNQLSSISGSPPNLQNLSKGCAFAPRCPFLMERCKTEVPKLEKFSKNQEFACFYKGLNKEMADKFIEVV